MCPRRCYISRLRQPDFWFQTSSLVLGIAGLVASAVIQNRWLLLAAPIALLLYFVGLLFAKPPKATDPSPAIDVGKIGEANFRNVKTTGRALLRSDSISRLSIEESEIQP